METKTCFDLNDAIRHWRDQLSQSPNFRPENLDELEAHLRDSVAAFQGSALSQEDAFLVARRRLGGAPALEPEFAKVNSREIWMNRFLWMLTGTLLWGAIVNLSRLAGEAGVIGAMQGFGYTPSASNSVLPGILFGVVQLAGLALCVFGCLWFFARAGAILAKATAYMVQRPTRLAVAVVAVSMLLLAGSAATWGTTAWLGRRLAPASYGALVYSRSLSFFFLVPLQTFALVTAAFLLARRWVRQRVQT
jgi:hypothetical protein